MKKIKHLSLICILCTIFSCVSQKKINYTIKKNEKISDIAKRYNLESKDILKLNPKIGSSPVEGTVIVIPIKGSTNNAVKVDQTDVSYKYHTVVAKETIYAITKMYEISKETLIKWNPQYPDIEKNLIDVGQILKVKRIEKNSVNYVTKVDDDHLTHIIGKDDTLYSITRKYNVTKEDLIILNPELSKLNDNIVNIGDLIKIKLLNKRVQDNYKTHVVQKEETLYSLLKQYAITKDQLMELNPELKNLENDIINIGDVLKFPTVEEVEKTETFYQDNIITSNVVRLAMLYPFNSNKYVDKKAKDIFKKNKQVNFVIDYYLGAEIAINSLREKGLDVQLSVFDTGRKGNNITKLIENEKLKDFDAIIGPFYPSQANKVARSVDSPVIFPHYSKKQINFSEQNLIKTSPETKDYIKKLSTHLRKNYTNEKIIIVGDGNNNSNKNIESLIIDLQKNGSILSSNIKVLKPEKGYIKRTRFTDIMNKTTKTWVILITNKTASISDALNSLLILSEKMDINVFTTRKGSAFKKIDNNKLARVNFTYVTDNYEDLEDESIKEFKKSFNVQNNTTPTKYAYKGYDITYDIATRLASGEKLEETFESGSSKRLTNKFYYNTNNLNCYENKGLFIIKYNEDLSLTRIDKEK